jgi:2-dehydro-3-deoxyphosphogluconate aldolase / (4S)-4-hydroxy-2-oxoglutarate aldolase
MNNIYDKLHNIGIIPVIKISDAKNAVPLAKALLKGGLSAAEITFRTDAAEDAIRQIARDVPEICVCAGTVLTLENAKLAVNAGAAAIISPGINPEVVRWCSANNIPVIPGCATPTEVEICMRMGLNVVKLFPAEVLGGVKMLKALSGPYADMKFMPTGGITMQNVCGYLKLPNVLCCGGSWMVPSKSLDDGDFAKIEELARGASTICRQVKEQN